MPTQRTCTVPNCTTRHYARGVCSRHYQRLLKYGDPLAAAYERIDAVKTCIVPECGRATTGSRGYCSAHLARVKRYGSPHVIVPLGRKVTAPDKLFWAKVEKTETCWLWKASILGHGYGQCWNGERRVLAHRFAYELLVGPIPAHLTVDHLCRTPRCVNPAHMELVTASENARREAESRRRVP